MEGLLLLLQRVRLEAARAAAAPAERLLDDVLRLLDPTRSVDDEQAYQVQPTAGHLYYSFRLGLGIPITQVKAASRSSACWTMCCACWTPCARSMTTRPTKCSPPQSTSVAQALCQTLHRTASGVACIVTCRHDRHTC